MKAIEQYLESSRGRFEDELADFVRIASVSSDPGCRAEMDRAAGWTADRLRRTGLTAEIIPTEGFPLVYAESAPVAGAPVCLVYGHYDVQPAGRLDQWSSPPFEPVRREGHLYGRGASDDKGQILAHIQSAEAWLETAGRLPLQLKFLIEGEEEIGGPSVERYLAHHAGKLACDCIVISDGNQFAPGSPAITCGLRGILSYELRLDGPNRDLHSGSFGGCVVDPANVLTKVLASIQDDRGRVLLPGFYDDVLPLSDEERSQWAALPWDEKSFLSQLGLDAGGGEEGFSLLQRRWARPTFDVCGLWGGHDRQPRRNIVPASAGAHFSFRLVPRQEPEKIAGVLRPWVLERIPAGIRCDLRQCQNSPSVLVPRGSPWIEAAMGAIADVFGRPPLLIREGASIPVVAALQQRLGADPLLIGWGQNTDNTHGPNERFSLDDYHRAAMAHCHLWKRLAELPTKEVT